MARLPARRYRRSKRGATGMMEPESRRAGEGGNPEPESQSWGAESWGKKGRKWKMKTPANTRGSYFRLPPWPTSAFRIPNSEFRFQMYPRHLGAPQAQGWVGPSPKS